MVKKDNYETFRQYIVREKEAAADELENTMIRASTWVHNLEWNGDRIAKLAAVVEIGDYLIELLSSPKHASNDSAIEFVKGTLQMEIIGCAKYPKMSTSPMANFMHVVRQQVRAEYHAQLIHILQR